MVDYSKIGKPREQVAGRKPDYPKLTVGEYVLEFETIEEAKGTKFGDFLFLTAKIAESSGRTALPVGSFGKWKIKLDREEAKGGEALVLQQIENLLEGINGGPGFDGEFLRNLLANPAEAKGTKFRASITREKTAKGMGFDAARFSPA
jgi:hypothetical protein